MKILLLLELSSMEANWTRQPLFLQLFGKTEALLNLWHGKRTGKRTKQSYSQGANICQVCLGSTHGDIAMLQRVGGRLSDVGDQMVLYILTCWQCMPGSGWGIIVHEHVVALMVMCWIPAVSPKKEVFIFWGWMVESLELLLPPCGSYWKTQHHKPVQLWLSWYRPGERLFWERKYPMYKRVQGRGILIWRACEDTVDSGRGNKNLPVGFMCI